MTAVRPGPDRWKGRIRPAAHTYPFRALPLEAALDEVARLGCRDVELWLGHAADAQAARAGLEARGLRAVAVSIGGVYRPGAPLLRTVGATAETLGVERLVGCVAPGLLPRLRAATPAKVEVLVENHWDQPLCGPREVLRELDGVANAGACLDTGHALLAGLRAEDFAAALGGAVRHVHLKDARIAPVWQRALGRRARGRLFARPEPVRPGDGDLDVEALTAVLAERGYEGVLSVEFEGEQPAEALAALLERVQA